MPNTDTPISPLLLRISRRMRSRPPTGPVHRSAAGQAHVNGFHVVSGLGGELTMPRKTQKFWPTNFVPICIQSVHFAFLPARNPRWRPTSAKLYMCCFGQIGILHQQSIDGAARALPDLDSNVAVTWLRFLRTVFVSLHLRVTLLYPSVLRFRRKAELILRVDGI